MRLFVPRDLDGFFGLFVDNLVQLLLIVGLCTSLCGMTGDKSYLVYKVILPGAAASILFGNLFYAWQAHRLAAREGRDDVTALPFGINTPSLVVFVLFVMLPVYLTTKSAEKAWLTGLVACIGSGAIEFVGAFVAEGVRRNTPRAALLSTLAGIAIGFIAMSFALKIWQYPLVAMAPLAVILVTYFSNVRFPLAMPGGFLAILVGTAIAWTLTFFGDEWNTLGLSVEKVSQAWRETGWSPPGWYGGPLWELLKNPSEWAVYLSVIVPMGLFNVIGSLQNIESAAAAGDKYDTRSSMAVNGLGTILGACCGSCFPTTIYIGHPGWKGLGARAGYSTLNGFVISLICLTGSVGLVQKLVPMEAGVAIVLWIGIIITAQAFQAT
ncbi:MAG: NCS2 family permease, partial [Planctomycetia bacterium]